MEASAAPPGDQLKRDTAIDLTVSKGPPQPIKIEDWTGRSTTDAKAALEKAGFTVKVTSEYSNTPQAMWRAGSEERCRDARRHDHPGGLQGSADGEGARGEGDECSGRPRGGAGEGRLQGGDHQAPNYVGLEAVSETNPPAAPRCPGSTITLSLV